MNMKVALTINGLCESVDQTDHWLIMWICMSHWPLIGYMNL